jgi:hypothetical protein
MAGTACTRGRPWPELAQPRHGGARPRRPSRSSPAPPRRGARRRQHLAVVARATPGGHLLRRPWLSSPAPPCRGARAAGPLPQLELIMSRSRAARAAAAATFTGVACRGTRFLFPVQLNQSQVNLFSFSLDSTTIQQSA